jgi:rubrerythrin
MLMTEKFVPGSYDIAIFKSTDPQVRQVLQHIQEDEQKHRSRYIQQSRMRSTQ